MNNQEVKEKVKKPFYKKVWFWILVVIVVAIAAGGSSDSSEGEKTVVEAESTGDVNSDANAEVENEAETDTDTEEDAEGSTEEVEEAEKESAAATEVSIETQVLAESDGIKVTATGIEDGFMGPEVKLQIENTSDISVTVSSRDVSVNGVMMSLAGFSGEVAAGKTANESLTFYDSQLRAAGIETIGEIELKVAAYTTDNWTDIFTTETQKILTSANGTFEQTYDDSGFVAVDQDGYRVIVKKLDSEDSFWGADIYVYIENNSDKDIMIQARDVSINGFMVDPMFSSEVIAGKKAFDSITFLESDLQDNGIEDITNMELYFSISDKNTWDTLAETDIVKVTFE